MTQSAITLTERCPYLEIVVKQELQTFFNFQKTEKIKKLKKLKTENLGGLKILGGLTIAMKKNLGEKRGLKMMLGNKPTINGRPRHFTSTTYETLYKLVKAENSAIK